MKAVAAVLVGGLVIVELAIAQSFAETVNCRGCGFSGDCLTVGLTSLDAQNGVFSGIYTADRATPYEFTGTYKGGIISFTTRVGSRGDLAVWPDRLKGNFQSYRGWVKGDVEMFCDKPTALATKIP